MKSNFVAAFVGFLHFAFGLAAQQAGFGGNAVDVLNRRALSGVHVRLVLDLPDVPAVAYGAISNATGHFSIDPVPPGTYALRTERPGFTFGGPAAITLKAGERVKDLRLEFTPEAVISGRLLDGNGDPVPGIQVDAIPSGSVHDPISGTTDDHGTFRLRGAAGRYRLRANTRSGRFFGTQAGLSDDDPNVDYATTYYPSSVNEEGAAVLDALAGRELSGNEIRLVNQRSLTISGVVTGLSAPGDLTTIFARPEGRDFEVGVSVFEERDGKFKLWRLHSGVYRVTARCLARKLRSRTVNVRVENTDVTGVELTLAAGEDVAGTLQMQGDRRGLVVLLEPEAEQEFDMLDRARGEVDKDGAFRVSDLFPGRYRVSVEPLPSNAYIQEIKLNGGIVSGVLDLSVGVRGSMLKVKVQTDGGNISGHVITSNGERLINTPVTVSLTSEPGKLADYTAPVTPEGSYQINGIRPGQYRIFAQAGAEGANHAASVAQDVVITSGGRVTKYLQLTQKADRDAKQ